MRQTPERHQDATDRTVKEIRRKTRKRYSSEEKMPIILAGLRGEDRIAEHKGIMSRKLFDKPQAILDENTATRGGRNRCQTPAFLKGLIFGPTGRTMSPSHTSRRGRLYRYHVDQSVLKNGANAGTIGRVPAAQIEGAVIDQRRIRREHCNASCPYDIPQSRQEQAGGRARRYASASTA